MTIAPRGPFAREIRFPADVRIAALTAIVVLACLAALRFAAGLIIPLVLSLLAAFALNPLVRALERLRAPRWLGALVAVGGTVWVLGGTVYLLTDDALAAARRLPEATEVLVRELREVRNGSAAPFDALARAANDLETAASEATGGARRTPRTAVPIDLGLREWIVFGPMTIVGFAGQLVLLVFLVYFLLASGDLFRRKIVRLAGPSMAGRRRAVVVLSGIQASLERFIVVVVATNAVVAAATWAAFEAFGVRNAAVFALAGGALNTIPYVGSAIAAGAYFVVALWQFGTVESAVLVAGAFVAITTIEGVWLRPWLMGRSARMNNVAVFVALLFWGWLWGAWGMLLAYPIMMVVKTVADHVEDMRPVGELLGD